MPWPKWGKVSSDHVTLCTICLFFSLLFFVLALLFEEIMLARL